MSVPRRYHLSGRPAAVVLLASLMSFSGCGGDGDSAAVVEEEHTEAEGNDVVLLDSTAIAIANITLVPVEAVQTTGR